MSEGLIQSSKSEETTVLASKGLRKVRSGWQSRNIDDGDGRKGETPIALR